MSQAQNNTNDEVKDFDFFTKTKKVAEKISNVSYRKLFFTTLMYGVFTGLGVGMVATGYHVWQGMKMEKQQDKMDSLNNEVAQIKAIDEAHFARFMTYLSLNQSFYDSRFSLLSKSVMDSVNDKHFSKDYDNPSGVISDLGDGLSEYKKSMEWRLNKFSNIYHKVHMGSAITANEREGDYKQLLQYYHNFEAGVWTTDPDVEKLLNKTLYSSKDGTLQYYHENHVMEAYDQSLKAENDMLRKLAF